MRNVSANITAGAEEDLGEQDGFNRKDDLMDKDFTSSSIGDHGDDSLPLTPTKRPTSFRSTIPSLQDTLSSETHNDVLPSFPSITTYEHSPLSFPPNKQDTTPLKYCHHKGKYARNANTHAITILDELKPGTVASRGLWFPSKKKITLHHSESDDLEKYIDEELDLSEFSPPPHPRGRSIHLDSNFDDASRFFQ